VRTPRRLILSATALIGLVAPTAAGAEPPAPAPVVTQLVTGLASGSGSTVGPDGALYVTEGATGSVLRVDPDTGEVSTFASGLPSSIIGIGGAMDIAFIGGTAYVLVTLVGSDVGGDDVVGIYRVDGPAAFTPIADIGQFSLDNPPPTSFFVPTGVQYALEAYRGGFLVTDGHHNRVLRVSLDGEITEVIQFGNIVPTGLAVRGRTVYMAAAGPVPHLPEDGVIVAFSTKSPNPVEVASGARLLVDVELGRGGDLFALSQGVFAVGDPEGGPAMPDTGSLVEVERDGTFRVIVAGLDQPTSLEIIGTTAFVVTLGGDIVRIDNVSAPPHGRSR
jgi:sugar lactone lactonase YvrE